jgi:hypothetical protein
VASGASTAGAVVMNCPRVNRKHGLFREAVASIFNTSKEAQALSLRSFRPLSELKVIL